MSNPVIDKINADLDQENLDQAGINREAAIDQWYETLTGAVEDGNAGLNPANDTSVLYLDSVGEPHWTASQRDIDVWQENKDKWTREALDYVKELQNGD